jgi:hypothetical protein
MRPARCMNQTSTTENDNIAIRTIFHQDMAALPRD